MRAANRAGTCGGKKSVCGDPERVDGGTAGGERKKKKKERRRRLIFKVKPITDYQ